MTEALRIAVIGAGYWGPNLARNFRASPNWNQVAIGDLDAVRGQRVADSLCGVRVETSLDALLAAADVDAIAIATPARTHHAITLAALAAGKHVMVEKPLADTGERGHEMVRAAAALRLVLMADHTYCSTPAVAKIREPIDEGALGDILFIDSVRINLGLIQPDVDVFWDLAPRDLSISDFVLASGLRPVSVTAQGADPLGAGKACVGYLTLPLQNGAIAHIHVNWLSPTKIRTMIIGGTKRTLVWDDLNPQQRVSVNDRGVDLQTQSPGGVERRAAAISYRLGDTWSPALAEREALDAMAAEFAANIRERRAPRTDADSGLQVLEAASRSLADGAMVRYPALPAREPQAELAGELATDRVTVIEGDIGDAAPVHTLCRGKNLVFRQASIRITQCAEEPRLAHEVLADGTFNVLEAAAAHGVDKVISASSASVYGMAEVFPTPESHHDHNNDTFYGAAKSFGEGMLRSFRAMYGLDYVALRYFNVYGPRMDVHGLYTEFLVRWMERIADGRPPLIFGDGLQTMDFIFTTDIARANLPAAASERTEGVYNVASGTETTLLGLAEALLAVMGSDLAVEHGPDRAVNGVVRRLAATGAARNELGFQARVGLHEGLRELVEWWRPLRHEIATGRVAVPS